MLSDFLIFTLPAGRASGRFCRHRRLDINVDFFGLAAAKPLTAKSKQDDGHDDYKNYQHRDNACSAPATTTIISHKIAPFVL